jgi:hypothetical protein
VGGVGRRGSAAWKGGQGEARRSVEEGDVEEVVERKEGSGKRVRQ